MHRSLFRYIASFGFPRAPKLEILIAIWLLGSLTVEASVSLSEILVGAIDNPYTAILFNRISYLAGKSDLTIRQIGVWMYFVLSIVPMTIAFVVTNRLLKKSLVDAGQGGKQRKSAVYPSVNEHFEPFSNAAWRRPRVFQQPVKGFDSDRPTKRPFMAIRQGISGDLAERWSVLNCELQSCGIGAGEKCEAYGTVG